MLSPFPSEYHIISCHVSRLWLHEMCREFGDGLPDDADHRELCCLLLDTTKAHFKENIKVVFEKFSDAGGSVSFF